MASNEVHKDLKNWNKIDNSIESLKYENSNNLTLFYWLSGILSSFVFAVLINPNNYSFNFWLSFLLPLLVLLGGIILFLIFSTNKANENIGWLYRKKDGQKV